MPQIEKIDASTYTISTEQPESDGTLTWNATTIVVAEARAGGKCGLGYSYCDRAAVRLIDDKLAPQAVGKDVFQIPAIWTDMVRSTRNSTRPGLASMAIAAV